MGQHGIKATYHEPFTPPEPVYHVTGTTTPDCTGNYYFSGQIEVLGVKYDYYISENKQFYLWPNVTVGKDWYIATELFELDDSWYRDDDDPVGDYDPQGTYLGVATVVEGPA